jgi:hypothetical protein
MTQSNFGTIDPNTKSGTVLAGDLNSWRDALHSMHSGSSRPSYAVAGTLWLDTASSSLWLIKLYDGTDDTIIAQIDNVNNVMRIPQRRQEVVKTSDYTMTPDDAYVAIIMNKTGAGTLSLPALSGTANELYFVKNVSADDVTIDPNAAETIEGASSLTLKQNDSAWIWVANGKTTWRAAVTGDNHIFNTVATSLGFDFFTDCVPAWVSNTSVSFSAGFGVFSGKRHTLPAYTKTMSAWAAGSGNGMLDTGAIGASQTYFLFAIRNIANGGCDYLASLSLTPLVPTGWEINSGSRVGIILTNSSSQIIDFKQSGNEITLSGGNVAVFSTSSTIGSTLTTLPSCPIGIAVDALLSLDVSANTSGDVTAFFSDGNNPNVSVSRARTFCAAQPSATAVIVPAVYVRTNSAGQVYRRITISGGTAFASGAMWGWRDYQCRRLFA